jgi:hypothetical protein
VAKSDKDIQRFLDSLPEGDQSKRDWLINKEAEYRMNGYTTKEAKAKALEDWLEQDTN